MRLLFFISGSLIVTICILASAPAAAADYPFSTHMVRHTTILLIAAPLLALSIPKQNFLKKFLITLSQLSLRLPFLTWIIGVGLMWVWHIPTLYNSMAMQMMMHTSAGMSHHMPVLHTLSLILGGMLFAWPIITPYPTYRLPPLKAVLYLSTACVWCSLLGLLITFAPAGTFLQTSVVDQQTGGLIMWVPCCFIYLSASMYLLIHWFSDGKLISNLKIVK